MAKRCPARFLAAAIVASVASAAAAQDYTVTAAGGLYENSPTNATVLFTTQDDAATFVTLPFSFVYFGQSLQSMQRLYERVHPVRRPGADRLGQHGDQRPGFTVRRHGGALLGGHEHRHELGGEWWASGTAPNRKVIVAWENQRHYTTRAPRSSSATRSSCSSRADGSSSPTRPAARGRLRRGAVGPWDRRGLARQPLRRAEHRVHHPRATAAARRRPTSASIRASRRSPGASSSIATWWTPAASATRPRRTCR